LRITDLHVLPSRLPIRTTIVHAHATKGTEHNHRTARYIVGQLFFSYSIRMATQLSMESDTSTPAVDGVRLTRDLESLRSAYKNAKPFPHVVIDDMFSASLLESLLTEMSTMKQAQWSRIEQDTRERTLRMRSAAELGPAGADMLRIVHSAPFLYLLSEITGVWQLIPDPYLQGAGYASMRRGDYFHVHSDRSVAYDTGLTRRLAMIVFLNKSWKPEYEGKLELWNDNATSCDATVEPLFNKTVIFEVAHPNFHGVPVPLACPADRSRQSFILYYHTVGIDGKSDVRPHTSIFAPRHSGTNRMTLRSLARDLTPPIITRALRKLTRAE
jgi:Rps23 Pro-64 3,4-dihydroxylase Tpa1-like proline 4-hydroxylase